MINEKRLKTEFKQLTKQAKRAIEQAGYDFWNLNYHYWPDVERNTNWHVYGAEKNTTNCFMGKGKTVKEAIANALNNAKDERG